jgi:hypothetical protein
LFNNKTTIQKLSELEVDIYEGNTCLSRGVSIELLKNKNYALKKMPKVINPTAINTPNTQSSSSEVFSNIDPKTGYWVFLRNNIVQITADSAFTNFRCN